MAKFISISIVSGILFGVLDGVIHANPLAQQLYAVYQPIAKTAINIPAGMIIDLIYGFIMAGIYMLLYNSLPGKTGLIKGINFAFLAWFFRVVMSVASSWMMYTISVNALLYTLICGLGEMLILGVLYGLTLKSFK